MRRAHLSLSCLQRQPTFPPFFPMLPTLKHQVHSTWKVSFLHQCDVCEFLVEPEQMRRERESKKYRGQWFWLRHVAKVIKKARKTPKEPKARLSHCQTKLWRRIQSLCTARLTCDLLWSPQREWPGRAGGISCEKCLSFPGLEMPYAVEGWWNSISMSSVPKWRESKDWRSFLFPSSEQGLVGSISLSWGKPS